MIQCSSRSTYDPIQRLSVCRLRQAAARLAALASVNKAVHLSTYNTLIGEEARKLSSEAAP